MTERKKQQRKVMRKRVKGTQEIYAEFRTFYDEIVFPFAESSQRYRMHYQRLHDTILAREVKAKERKAALAQLGGALKMMAEVTRQLQSALPAGETAA